MNEVIYNIKLTIGFILIISFLLYWYTKLEQENLFHTNDFVGLTQNFQIALAPINTSSGDTIFIVPNMVSPIEYGCLRNIPLECEGEKKYSIVCLKKIKEKGNGFYNGSYFKPSDIKCRK